jgi:hypothetical protein
VNWPKIIFGAIFLIIWAISAFVSWINKQQQEAKRRRVREELEGVSQRVGAAMRQAQRRPPPMPPPRQPQRIAEGLAQRFPDVLLPPAPLPPPPIPQQQRRPMPVPRQTMPPKPVRRAPKQPQVRRPAPLPPPVQPPLMVLEEVTPQTTSPISDAPQTARSGARAKPPVDAVALAKWLKPATLRQQFMLTEILQPPLALRSDSDHR